MTEYTVKVTATNKKNPKMVCRRAATGENYSVVMHRAMDRIFQEMFDIIGPIHADDWEITFNCEVENS